MAGRRLTGAVITPFYDSLLVKLSASGNRFIEAARRMERRLQEFRVRGVKTNIPFLLNVITHPDFLAGRCTTRFIDESPELFRFAVRQDRATRLLTFVAEVTVNGFPGVVRPTDYVAQTEPPPPPRSTPRSPRPRAPGSCSRSWARSASPAGSASRSPC